MTQPDNDRLAKSEKPKKKSGVVEILESIIIAVVLAALIRVFIFSPFYIPSGSMQPTLDIGDRIIVSKINYTFSEPERGDIVVFKFPENPDRDFVKRVIGIEGETVAFRDNKLYINGNHVKEYYLPGNVEEGEFGPVEVPEDHYFMVGDNRNNSDDSRRWGPLHEDYIVGEAVLIYWPPNRISLLE